MPSSYIISGEVTSIGNITGMGASVGTALTIAVGSAGSFVVNGGALGTPSSGTLTSCTGLPISTGVSGLGTGVATWLATPTSANLASAVATTSTGSGALTFATSPTFTTSIIAASSTMALFNTTATTVNAFGAATNIVMGGANSTGTTTSSQISVPLNSLTTGTGLYLASSTLTTGKIIDIQVTGSTFATSPIALNVSLAGTNNISLTTSTAATFSNTRTNFSSNVNVALTLTASGGTTNTALNVTAGGVVIGSSGTPLLKILSSTATLNFPSTSAGAVSDLTITVTGAALGDTVAIGTQHGSVPAAGDFTGWVSSANTVTIRYANNALVTAYDPASGTFRATVFQF